MEIEKGFKEVIETLTEKQSEKQSENQSEERTDITSTPQRRYVREHSTCAMCESTLEIRHDVNRADLKVKEEAHCPSCGIRVRSAHHLMH